MEIEMTDSAEKDELAVAAVRDGDAERYRELVERYERQAYAVAWSRLGDAALAEEAAQEAFIRGYRQIGLLGNGAKFSGWISSITRNIAINLGLRNRRELKRRERWALDHLPEATSELDESDAPHSPGTLRQSLEELPAKHRECLVLFYLESKSGAEAATALGISESAFRVRLHRARGALREQLENKLASSLEKLRPGKALTPAIMATLLASPSAKAATIGGTTSAGIGAKILSTFGKSFLFSWMLPLIVMVPSILFSWFSFRADNQNFREPNGFRARLHRQIGLTVLWGFPLIMLSCFCVSYVIKMHWGINSIYVGLGLLLVPQLAFSARMFTVNRNRFHLVNFFGFLFVTVAVGVTAVGWLPYQWFSFVAFPGILLSLLTQKHRPARMDYNLFLRATEGLLRFPSETETVRSEERFHRSTLLAFARFLGSHFLLKNFRWEKRGLALGLPPAKPSFIKNLKLGFPSIIGPNSSHIVLEWDGTVTAHCSARELNELAAMAPRTSHNPAELESLVAKSVTYAWQKFREQDLAAAAHAIGNSPESEVFVVPPAKAKSVRWLRRLGFAVLLLILPLLILLLWRPVWMSGMKPVSITEAQVRSFLNDATPNPDPRRSRTNSALSALSRCMLLPSTNLFSSEGLSAMRDEIVQGEGFDSFRRTSRKIAWLTSGGWSLNAVGGGWISLNDFGLQPSDVAEHIRIAGTYMRDNHWEHFLQRRRFGTNSWIKRIGFPQVMELQFLKTVDSLAFTGRNEFIQLIASVQALPGQTSQNNWRPVRGLFYTRDWPPLQDTYYSLAALEILDGLDGIDREACIEGILKHHAGEGFFTSPVGGISKYQIKGDAQDTIAAFESLRILNALERVEDLEKWEFRPNRNGVPDGVYTWYDVEAWGAKQRFERFLRERRENPQAPARSLLEP